MEQEAASPGLQLSGKLLSLHWQLRDMGERSLGCHISNTKQSLKQGLSMREVVQKKCFAMAVVSEVSRNFFWNHCFILEGDLQFYFRNVNEEKNKASSCCSGSQATPRTTHSYDVSCSSLSMLLYRAEHTAEQGVDSKPVSPFLVCYPLRWTSLRHCLN